MVREKGNYPDSVSKSFKVLRTILNQAVRDDIIQEHALKDYKVGKIEGNREFLTLEQVKSLHQLYDTNTLLPGKQNVLQYFLFACYTGIRYGDIEDLRFNDITDNALHLKTQKTGKVVKFRLIPQALQLIPASSHENQKVFRVYGNQVTNRHLKGIIAIAKIKKSISFHCARHTFATISIDLGIPTEIVSQNLGHTDINTTKIYARIREGRINQELEKWNI